MLHTDLLWGVARLVGVRPGLAQDAAFHFLPYLESKNPAVRGLAARILGLLKAREAHGALEALIPDRGEFQMWEGNRFVDRQVGQEAGEALRRV